MADLPPHRPGLTAGPPDARRPQGRYCVVIPALNAAATIGALVAKVRGCGLNVVVVDDGSTDRTAAVAAAGGALVISHLRNRGKGHALRTGFEYAVRERYDGVVTLDSDGQHDPAEIPALIQAGEVQHAALVLGDRMANGLSMPAARRRTNQVMSRIISRLAGQPVPDSQCGFRLIRRELLERLRLRAGRFDIESEVVLSAAAERWKIVSVPVTGIYRGGPSHIQPVRDGLRFAGLVARFLLRPRRSPRP